MKLTSLSIFFFRIWWALVVLLLLCYLLPWVINPGISLSLGGYDLAEWISLRLPDRPMDSVLLLRLPPVMIVIMAALMTSHPRFSGRWWAGLLCIGLTAIALLPPFEFFLDSGLRSDVNYSQQFNLAVMTMIASGIALTGLLERWKNFLLIILSAATIAISFIGWTRAWEIMLSLQLPVRPGLGILGLLVITAGIVITLIPSVIRSLTGETTTPSTAAKGV